MMLPFPSAWYSPTPAAERAAAAIGEGFCPYSHGPLSEEGDCGPCDARWKLIRQGGRVTGLTAEYGWPSAGKLVGSLTIYPFSEWQLETESLRRRLNGRG